MLGAKYWSSASGRSRFGLGFSGALTDVSAGLCLDQRLGYSTILVMTGPMSEGCVSTITLDPTTSLLKSSRLALQA